MTPQRTLRRATSCAGIGLHSGHKVSLTLRPAPADTGIRFRRVDLGGVEVPAHVSHVSGISYATVLSADGVRIETVEHLITADHASFNSSPVTLGRKPVNGRASLRFSTAPRCEFIFAATASNGASIGTSDASGSQFEGDVNFEEI
jgi:hypothetical protein